MLIATGRVFILSFLVATKQLKEHFCLSVRPSDRYTFFTMFLPSYHREIFWSYYQWQKWCPCKGQRQRSKVNITEVTTQFSRFRTVTTVWIQLWWRNDAQSLMFLRRGALLFFEVIRHFSRCYHFFIQNSPKLHCPRFSDFHCGEIYL